MPSVIVVGRGLPFDGDVTNIYEGTPYATNMPACYGDIFGTVSLYDYESNQVDPEASEPLVNAYVWDSETDWQPTSTDWDTTSYSGGYELTRVPSGDRIVSAWKFGYYPRVELVELECGADTKQDFLLVCQGILYGTVEDAATNTAIEGTEVTLDVWSVTLGRTWHITATTDDEGLWWMIVPLVGNAEDDDAPWTLTISMAGYDDWVDRWVDNNGNGIPEDGEPNTAFADDVAAGADPFDSSDCVGVGSEGCNSGEDFCAAPNNVFEDHAYVGSDTELNAYAKVQGRVYCDGLVSDSNPDLFNPGEEQPNVLVKLLKDGGVSLYDSKYTDASGFYQFTVGHDFYPDFVFGNNLDVCASTECKNADGVDPGETIVININICPPIQP